MKQITQRYHRTIFAVLFSLSVTTTACFAQEQAKPETMSCINADNIVGYKIVSDEVIRLAMQGGQDLLMRLKRHCPQLHFHKYVSYTPVNGRLCARFDDVFTRSGTPCRIESFSSAPDDEGTANH